MGTVSLDYAAPEPALKEFVSVFYHFRADVPHFSDDERADLAQFRFMLSGQGSYRFVDGYVQAGPLIQIVGPTTGSSHVNVDGPVEVFGMGLLPAGWGAIVPVEASQLLNRLVDATEFFGRELHDVADQLRDAESLDAKVAIAGALVRKLVAQGVEQPRWFTRQVDAWLGSRPDPQVDDLVSGCGLSRRQVERLCKRLYGAPPKLLARKYRALRAAMALAKGEASVADVLDHGFYDQSHCIREIKHFTGITPKRLVGDLPELTRLTLKRTEFGGEHVALLVGQT